MQDEVDKLFVVRLACSNVLEVFDEALETWWRNSPLDIRECIEYYLLHILELDLVAFGLEIQSPRGVLSLGEVAELVALVFKDSICVTCCNQL